MDKIVQLSVTIGLPRKGDWGYQYLVPVDIDLSKIPINGQIVGPNDNVVNIIASGVTINNAYYIAYTFQPGDLSIKGTRQLQFRASQAGQTLYQCVSSLTVYDNIR